MKNLRILCFGLATILLVTLGCSSESMTAAGVNSSYSSMITVGNFLYQVDPVFIITYDVSDPADPIEIDRQELGFEIETVYHFGGVLFVGSARALYIFEIDEKGIPVEKSETVYDTFEANQTPCDPVVSDGQFAYVTLSTTTTNPTSACFRPEPFNMLFVYDISNISEPKLVVEQELNEPKGLSLDGDYLFVCDGSNGLVIFDKSDINNLTKISHLQDGYARDVIAREDHLIVIGLDELRQYDYSDITSIMELGTLML